MILKNLNYNILYLDKTKKCQKKLIYKFIKLLNKISKYYSKKLNLNLHIMFIKNNLFYVKNIINKDKKNNYCDNFYLKCLKCNYKLYDLFIKIISL